MSGARPRRKSGSQARRPGKPLRRRIGRTRLPARRPHPGHAPVHGHDRRPGGGRLRAVAAGHRAGPCRRAYTPADQRPGDPGRLPRRTDPAPSTARRCATGWLRCRRWRTPGSSCGCPASCRSRSPRSRRPSCGARSGPCWSAPRDGTIITELPLTGELPDGLRRLPSVDDERFVSRLLSSGDVVPPAELRVANRLTALDAAGSSARGRRHSRSRSTTSRASCWSRRSPPGRRRWASTSSIPARTRRPPTRGSSSSWRPSGPCSPVGRNATSSWLDARNPGKVYWRP